jgi:hypothetical protein
MVLLLEESQPVASADGWMQTVTIEQIEQTPRGSRQVLQSASYSQSTGFVPISHLVTTVCSNDPPDALRTRRGTPPADP